MNSPCSQLRHGTEIAGIRHVGAHMSYVGPISYLHAPINEKVRNRSPNDESHRKEGKNPARNRRKHTPIREKIGKREENMRRCGDNPSKPAESHKRTDHIAGQTTCATEQWIRDLGKARDYGYRRRIWAETATSSHPTQTQATG